MRLRTPLMPRMAETTAPVDAVPPTPVATDYMADVDPNHPGWAPRAWGRFQQAIRHNREMRDKIATLESDPAGAEVETLRQQVADAGVRYDQLRQQHNIDLVLVSTGGNFQHASVQRMIRREYEAHVAEAGKDALPFVDWFGSDAVKGDPLFAPHFATLTAAVAAAPVSTGESSSETTAKPTGRPEKPSAPDLRTAPAVDPNAGASDSPAAPSTSGWTADQIGVAGRDPGAWKRHREQIREGLERTTGTSLGAGRRYPDREIR